MDTIDDINVPGQSGETAGVPDSLETIAAQVDAELEGSEVQGEGNAAQGDSEDEMSIFSLSEADADEGEDAAAEEADADDESGEEYQFDLGEKTQIPQVIHESLGALAQKLGVPGDKAASLLNEGLAIYQEAHREAMKKSLADLREEWGDKFTPNVKATKAFIVRLGKAAGLGVDEMGALECPHGMRLMNALRVHLNETGSYAGAPHAAPKLTPQQQIDAIFADPVKAEAMLDPGHPQYKAVHAELDGLYALRG